MNGVLDLLGPARRRAEGDFRKTVRGRAAQGVQHMLKPSYYTYGRPAVSMQSGGGVHGPGSGRDDAITAHVSNGEYVMDAETVALLGDGSTDEGIRRLDEMRKNLRKHKGASLSKGRFSPNSKRPEAYVPKMKSGGRVKPRRSSSRPVPPVRRLLELADKLEKSLQSNDSRAAAKIGAEMDVISPGTSRRARAEFSRGGSIAKAIREMLSRRRRRRPTASEEVEQLRSTPEGDRDYLEQVAMELDRLNPGNRLSSMHMSESRPSHDNPSDVISELRTLRKVLEETE